MKNNTMRLRALFIAPLILLCLFTGNLMAQSSITIKVSPLPIGILTNKTTVCPEVQEPYTLTGRNDGVPTNSTVILDASHSPAWEVINLDGTAIAGGSNYGATLVGTPTIDGATFTFSNSTNADKDVIVRVYLQNDSSKCTNFVDDTLTINARPDMDITGLTSGQIVCSGFLNTYSIQAIPGTNPNGATFVSWEIKSATVGTTGVFVGANNINPTSIYFNNTTAINGTARVVLYYEKSPCGTYADSIDVVVKPNPALAIVTPTFNTQGAACSEQPYSFTIGAATAGATFTGWTASTVANLTTTIASASTETTNITFVNTSNADINTWLYATYTMPDAANGDCNFKDSVQVTVHPRPQMTIAGLANNDEVCSGNSNQYMVSASTPSGGHAGTFLRWEFSTPSSGSITGQVVGTNASPANIYFGNSTASNGTIYLVAVYKDADSTTTGCNREYRDSIQVTVKPGTEITINKGTLAANNETCSERTYTFASSATIPANATFVNWTTNPASLPAGVTANFSASTSATTDVYFNNTTNADAKVLIFANYSGGSCTYKDSVEVTIYPRPNMDIVGLANGGSVCAGSNTYTVDTINGQNGAANLAWTYRVHGTGASVAFANAAAAPTGVLFTNETTAPIDVTLILSYASTTGSNASCGTYQDSIVVTVQPRPRVDTILIANNPVLNGGEICAGSTLDLDAAFVNATFTQWQVVSVTGGASATIANVNAEKTTIDFANTTGSQQTATIKVSYTGTNGDCAGKTFDSTFTVIINPAITDVKIATTDNQDNYCLKPGTTTYDVEFVVEITGGTQDFTVEWTATPAGTTPASGTITGMKNIDASNSNKFTVNIPVDGIEYTIQVNKVTDSKGCTWVKP